MATSASRPHANCGWGHYELPQAPCLSSCVPSLACEGETGNGNSDHFRLVHPLPDPPPHAGEGADCGEGRASTPQRYAGHQPMTPFTALLLRDMRLAVRVGGGALMGALFFLIV